MSNDSIVDGNWLHATELRQRYLLCSQYASDVAFLEISCTERIYQKNDCEGVS